MGSGDVKMLTVSNQLLDVVYGGIVVNSTFYVSVNLSSLFDHFFHENKMGEVVQRQRIARQDFANLIHSGLDPTQQFLSNLDQDLETGSLTSLFDSPVNHINSFGDLSARDILLLLQVSKFVTRNVYNHLPQLRPCMLKRCSAGLLRLDELKWSGDHFNYFNDAFLEDIDKWKRKDSSFKWKKIKFFLMNSPNLPTSTDGKGKKMEEKNMEYPFHIQAVGFSGFFSRNLLHFAFYLISQPIENVGFEPQVWNWKWGFQKKFEVDFQAVKRTLHCLFRVF